jgi:predicted RNA-binding Zn-ribbon protein involved in translation (DUF1610 family)
MSTCTNCKTWLVQRVTDYANGERIVNYQAPVGKGLCEVIHIETDFTFGCNRFVEGHQHIEIIGIKTGSPWMHSRWGGCPECGGSAIGCDRCQTTGRVLYYDDGYIGEERTRRHPKEATLGPPPEPKCLQCGAVIELKWKACPHCGRKVEHPTVERVDGLVGDNTMRETTPITESGKAA